MKTSAFIRQSRADLRETIAVAWAAWYASRSDERVSVVEMLPICRLMVEFQHLAKQRGVMLDMPDDQALVDEIAWMLARGGVRTPDGLLLESLMGIDINGRAIRCTSYADYIIVLSQIPDGIRYACHHTHVAADEQTAKLAAVGV